MFGGGSIVPFMVHGPIGGCDGPFRTGSIDETKPVLRLDRSFLQHTEIPAGETCAFNLHGQILDPPAPGQFPAGLSGLRNLDDGRADRKPVADTHLCFREPLQREIFTECAADELIRREDALPIGPMVRRIGTQGLVEASMVDEVSLTISVSDSAGRAKSVQ